MLDNPSFWKFEGGGNFRTLCMVFDDSMRRPRTPASPFRRIENALLLGSVSVLVVFQGAESLLPLKDTISLRGP